MICVFSVSAGPFIITKGQLFPKKSLTFFAQNDTNAQTYFEYRDIVYCPEDIQCCRSSIEQRINLSKNEKRYLHPYRDYALAFGSGINLLTSFFRLSDNILRTYVYIWLFPFVIGLIEW